MNQAIDHQAHPAAPTNNAGFNPAPWHALMAAVRDAFPARLDTTNPSLALTRVVVEAAEHLNYLARPAPVFVDITRGTETSRREGGIDERALLHSPYGWSGHLVTLLDLGPGQRILLDASADRFDRPIRNLLLGGPVTALAHTDATIARVRPRHDDHTCDTTVTYRPIPSGHPGRDGWRESQWWQPDTDATATAIRAAETAAQTVAIPPPRTGAPTHATLDPLLQTHPKAG